MKLILTGFMGAGKSTIAKILAKNLGWEWLEMDEMIVKKSGESSVSDIFYIHGESHFRALEKEVAQEIAHHKNVIVSTGGGVGADPRLLETLCGDLRLIVFLKSSFESAQKRIGNEDSRPLFTSPEQAKLLFEKRMPQYQKNADWIIETDKFSPKDIAEKIEKIFHTKPQICTVVMGKTIEEFLTNLEKHQIVSNFVELRVDFIENLKLSDISKIKEHVTKKSIFTCRRKEEGGHFAGSENERLEILKSASKQFDFVDIELRTLESNPGVERTPGLNLICSWHDFEQTPDLENIFKRMEKFNPRVYKIISTAQRFSDTTKVFQLLTNHSDKKMIALSMGSIGQCTRKLTPLLGGFLTFATLDGEASAPGQMELGELKKFYKHEIPLTA